MFIRLDYPLSIAIIYIGIIALNNNSLRCCKTLKIYDKNFLANSFPSSTPNWSKL